MSGCLAFGLLVNDKIAVIATFLFTTFVIFKEHLYTNKYLIFIIAFAVINLLPGLYESGTFSYSSTLHILMKVSIGISTILILRESFINYYLRIIIFCAIISLVCFTLNSMGILLPYISIETTKLDGGNIFRVSSIVYTQLYNVLAEELTVRNSGPFWEPGAYQGFLNLGLALMTLSVTNRDKNFYIIYLLLSICVITTFSTGGYIALSINLILLLITDSSIKNNTKILITAVLFIIFLSVFFSLDFLYDKIESDQARLGVSLDDLGNGLNLLFGYGYSANSFKGSTLDTASSLILLFKYNGLCGFLLYVGTLIGDVYSLKKIIWVFIICMILMNEPFLTTGPFWWGIPFVLDYLATKKTTKELFKDHYVTPTQEYSN